LDRIQQLSSRFLWTKVELVVRMTPIFASSRMHWLSSADNGHSLGSRRRCSLPSAMFSAALKEKAALSATVRNRGCAVYCWRHRLAHHMLLLVSAGLLVRDATVGDRRHWFRDEKSLLVNFYYGSNPAKPMNSKACRRAAGDST